MRLGRENSGGVRREQHQGKPNTKKHTEDSIVMTLPEITVQLKEKQNTESPIIVQNGATRLISNTNNAKDYCAGGDRIKAWNALCIIKGTEWT